MTPSATITDFPVTSRDGPPRGAGGRVRKRTPISCLNCKKRKVKCDKGRPACSGCVKNNVPHLCVYKDPEWAEKEPSSANPGPVSSESRPSINYDQIVSQQRTEIDQLKRRLAVMSGLSRTKVQSAVLGLESLANQVSVLNKLNPNIAASRDEIEVKFDGFYTILAVSPSLTQGHTYVDVYSWLNIIKLDPQLTSLWYKITQLQKIYHAYKISVASGPKREIQSAFVTNPLAKHAHYITEVDFTYSLGKPSSSPKKCPVVECDFNMDERGTSGDVTPEVRETENGGNGENGGFPEKVHFAAKKIKSFNGRNVTFGERGPFSDTKTINSSKTTDFSPQNTQFPPKNTAFSSQNASFSSQNSPFSFHSPNPISSDLLTDNINVDSANILRRLQKIWASLTRLVRGNEPLSHAQLLFLVDFYFSNSQYETESRSILSFYKNDICGTVKKDKNGLVSLNLDVHGLVLTSLMDDLEMYGLFVVKGIYACMLALLVEESFDILRLNVQLGQNDALSASFCRLFPSEAVYLGLGYKGNNILSLVEEYLASLSSSTIVVAKVGLSLCAVAACIGLLNRQVTLYKHQGSVSDVKPGFTTVFHILLDIMSRKDGKVLEIWKDPSTIGFQDKDRRQVRELRLHITHLWCDFVRLINLVTFDFVLLVKHRELVSAAIQTLHQKIEEVEVGNHHIRYVSGLSGDENAELVVALHVNYLVARVFSTLRRGIVNVNDSKITLLVVQNLISETTAWSNDLALGKLRRSRFFEARCALQYLDFFLNYVALLQAEEDETESVLQLLVPELFRKCVSFVGFLKETAAKPSEMHTQYFLLALTETVSRTMQLVVGLLLRIKNEKLFEKFQDLPESGQIIEATTETIETLVTSQLLDKDKPTKLAKLWNFYVTFVKNSLKMNAINYAKMHANVPGFKKLVLKESGSETPGKTEFARCPISHIISDEPVTEEPPKTVLMGKSHGLKCPIDHKSLVSGGSKCPIDHKSLVSGGSFDHQAMISKSSGSKCPVDLKAMGSSKKSKCPIDHSLLTKPTPLPLPQPEKKRKCPFDHESLRKGVKGFSESHVRGKPLVSESPKDDSPAVPDLEAVMKSVPGGLSEAELPDSKETVSFGVNWNDFAEFDFDFLQNGVLFNLLGEDPMTF